MQRRADNENRAAQHNHLSSAESVTEEKREERSSETTNFIDGNDGALKGSRPFTRRSGIDFRKFSGECVAREQA